MNTQVSEKAASTLRLVPPPAVTPPAPEAVVWKARFEGAIRGEMEAKMLALELQQGIADRLWATFRDETGRLFPDFKSFCEARPPRGLGVAHAEVNRLLVEVWGERWTRLTTAPCSRQGQRTSGHGVRKSQTKRDQRDRAILDAPDPIKDLYARELLGVREAVEAGRLARSKPASSALADASRIAQELLDHAGGSVSKAEQKRAASQRLREILAPHARPDAEGPPDTAAHPIAPTSDSVYQAFLTLPPEEKVKFRLTFVTEQLPAEIRA